MDLFWLWEFCGLIAFMAVWTLRRAALRSGKDYIVTFALMWGTALHELAHYLVAAIAMAKPQFPNLIATKRVQPDGSVMWELGSVVCERMNSVNCLFVGIAPLILLPIAAAVSVYWYAWFDYSFAIVIAKYVFLQLLLSNCLPSGADWRIAFQANWFAIIALLGVVAVAVNMLVKILASVAAKL